MSVHWVHRMFWPVAAAAELLSGVFVSQVSAQANYSKSCMGVGDGSLCFASDAAADFDGNGAIAVPDIFAFLSGWFAGC